MTKKRRWTEEQKRAMSEKMKGRPGRPWSEEEKRAHSERMRVVANAKKALQSEERGDVVMIETPWTDSIGEVVEDSLEEFADEDSQH